MGLLDRLRTPPPPARKEKGRSGTVNTRGFLSSAELNTNLTWPRNLDLYDEMRRTDPTIRWMMAIIKNPILASPAEIEPASDDPEDMEIAAAVEHCLFEQLDGGFENWLRQALLYLDFGHYVFERVADFRPVEFTWQDKTGEEHTTSRDMFVIDDLAPRLPRTIQRWITPDGNPRRLLAIEQWLLDGTGQIEIKADRLVVLVNEREGDDFRGTSLLRSSYKSYRYKTQLENLEAIALERSAGFLVCYPPNQANDDQLDEMEEALAAARQGENLYMIAPGPKQTPQVEGWTIEDLAVSGDGSKSTTGNTAAGQAIARHEASMARNVLAEFMRLGHEETGARAVGDVQQDPYWHAVEAIVGYVERVIQEQLIAPLVGWNYETARLPKLRFSKVQAKNVQVIADAWTKLIKEGAVVPSVEDENWIRGILDAPQRKPPADGEDDGLGRVEPQPEPGDDDPGEKQTMGEFRPRREARGVEQFVALQDVHATLERGQQELLNVAVRASRQPVAATVSEAKMADSPAKVERLTVDPSDLEQPILALLHDMYLRGRAEVDAELRRQGGPARFESHPSPQERLARLSALAAGVAASISAAATRAIKAFALRRLETTRSYPVGPGYDADAAVRGAARGSALNVISAAFNDGRRDQMLARKGEIAMAVYSAILDTNTCGPCIAADGREAEPGGAPDLPTPNPACEGGGACRCMWIPVIKRAGSAVAFPEGIPEMELPEAA